MIEAVDQIGPVQIDGILNSWIEK